MEHYLANITHYITSHPQIGLICALLIAFAESLPIVGTIIPGSLTMTAIGILIGQNALPLVNTLLLAVVGALIGDIIGYWLGKHYQNRIHKVWPFKRYPKMLVMGRDFFQKHGGKSIVLGRFIGPTRSSVPLIAGLLQMRWVNFLVAAIPSAFLWAAVYLFPGILLGAISLTLPKGKATTFTLVGLAVIVLLWLIFWAIQRGFVYIANRINRMTDRCWDWLSTHHGARLIPRLLTSKRNPQDHHQLTLLIFAAVLLAVFGFIFVSVIFHWGIYHANAPVFHLLQNLRSAQLNRFFVVITELGEFEVITLISLTTLLYLTLKRQWYAAWHLVIIFCLAAGSVWFFKHIYFSPRPEGFMVVKPNSSFPSGHTTLTTTVIGFLAFLFAQCLKQKWRWIPYTAWGILVFLAALSRITLGAHWFCDVIAGACFGSALLLVTIISYRRWLPILKQPTQLMIAILITFLLPWVYAATADFHRNIYRYTPYFPNRIIQASAWWQDSIHYAPIYRLSRLGNSIQPFNLQWSGNPDSIEKFLETRGWQEISTKPSIKKILARFTTSNPEQHIALLAQHYQNQPPVLFMIKHPHGKNYIIELRLWRTNIGFIEKMPALLIGSINYHLPSNSLINLQPSEQITLRHGGGIDELITSLDNDFIWKKITVKKKPLPKKIQGLQWDKQVLLIREVAE